MKLSIGVVYMSLLASCVSDSKKMNFKMADKLTMWSIDSLEMTTIIFHSDSSFNKYMWHDDFAQPYTGGWTTRHRKDGWYEVILFDISRPGGEADDYFSAESILLSTSNDTCSVVYFYSSEGYEKRSLFQLR
jgi:hypothetical protein